MERGREQAKVVVVSSWEEADLELDNIIFGPKLINGLAYAYFTKDCWTSNNSDDIGYHVWVTKNIELKYLVYDIAIIYKDGK